MNKFNMSLILVMSLLITFFSSCEKHWKKEGSGILQTTTRDLVEFDHLNAEGAYDIYFYLDSVPRVTITTDNNLIQDVKTYVQEGILFIEMDDEFQNYDYSQMKVQVYGPTMNHLELNGAVDFYMEDMVVGENMRLDHNGSGFVRVRYSGGSMRLATDGSADVEAIGECDMAEYHIHGSGKIDALSMIVYDALADIEGSGDISLHCDHNLFVHISGSGDVRYTGSPLVTTEISGSGSVGPY